MHQAAGSASARASYLRQVFKAPRDSGEVALRLARAEGEHREQRAETPRAAAHGGENTTKPRSKNQSRFSKRALSQFQVFMITAT